jgi:hypothetical protein
MIGHDSRRFVACNQLEGKFSKIVDAINSDGTGDQGGDRE